MAGDAEFSEVAASNHKNRKGEISAVDKATEFLAHNRAYSNDVCVCADFPCRPYLFYEACRSAGTCSSEHAERRLSSDCECDRHERQVPELVPQALLLDRHARYIQLYHYLLRWNGIRRDDPLHRARDHGRRLYDTLGSRDAQCGQ